MNHEWVRVHYPIEPGDRLPPERKTVLVWLAPDSGERGTHLPFCAYLRYAAGDIDCPFFVVYHGNERIGAAVIAWCDCLPDTGPPEVTTTGLYDRDQRTGRGMPARIHSHAISSPPPAPR